MSDDDGPPAKKAKTDLPPCPYGANCYRKNPVHFKEFSHPKKGDDTPDKAVKPSGSGVKHIDTSKLPVCPFGANCYRKNLIHFAEYSHPYSGGGASALPDDDSGSDTDVLEDEEDDSKNNVGSTLMTEMTYDPISVHFILPYLARFHMEEYMIKSTNFIARNSSTHPD